MTPCYPDKGNNVLRNVLQREWREEKLLAWSFGGLWVFVTAFLWSPSRDGSEAVYALGFFIPMLMLLPWRKPIFHQYGGWFSVSALAYASWCCITSLWGGDTGFFILQWLILAAWLLGSAFVLQRRALDLKKLFTWMFGIGVMLALLVMVLFYKDHPVSDRLEGLGLARTPTVLGQVFGLVVLLATILSWRVASFKQSMLFFAAALCASAALALSQSRGPMLSLLLALLLAMVWIRPALRVWLSQITFLLLVAIVLVVMTPIEELIAARGISLRDEIWLQVWHSMISQPLTLLSGIGMSEVTLITTANGEYHHAHNAWLDIFYRTGAIGLLLALTHLVLLLKRGGADTTTKSLTIWFVYGCFCLLVDSRSLFWEIDAKWLLYWVPAALLAAQLSRGLIVATTDSNTQE
jgi:hypothetical protein